LPFRFQNFFNAEKVLLSCLFSALVVFIEHVGAVAREDGYILSTVIALIAVLVMHDFTRLELAS
jgi:hypothetical protein